MDQQLNHSCTRCRRVIGSDGVYGNNANAIEVTVYGKKGEPKKTSKMITGLCETCVAEINRFILRG